MKDRGRRTTAGNRMAKLLNEEEECQDEFYKVNYGGFQETATDNEYEAEEEGEDQVDSDFSIDENDEPVSDTEEESQRKKRRLVTKAYKEPAPKQKPKSPKPKPAASKETSDQQQTSDQGERKSIRKSTAAKSAATAQRVKIRTLEQKRKIKRPKEEEWIPTQAELLEEAKVTELENVQALERYQKMESEKKSRRTFKRTCFGPIIRYHSMRMPIIEESETNVEKPAKYVDPLTCLPYHDILSFKLIREAYYQQLEAHGDRNDPVMAKWLDWYSKNKEKTRQVRLNKNTVLKLS
ncbi:hypothetical protein FQR65_LT05554 [Abscondita terminalis]|nr:hypothetical protein FQR65_LT05554 [Abscondita terminalis]